MAESSPSLRAWKYRHRHAFDLSGVGKLSDRQTIQGALNACDYPFGRVKRVAGRIPVAVSDLSRFSAGLQGSHSHVHDEDGEGHLLAGTGLRRAVLGLYWLPTTAHPGGRIELDAGMVRDPILAQEVFLAEAAHCVDYVVMTDDQRAEIAARLEHSHGGHDHAGWFEERGEQNYYAWRGERWMAVFMAAFAPSLPRPLEEQQPWHHSYDADDLAAVRAMLL